MSRKRKYFELVKELKIHLNWNICVLCQNADENSELRCPANNISKEIGVGYKSLAKDLCAFYEAGELAESLKISEFCCNGADRLESLLLDKKAVFHKRCRRKFEQYHLVRMRSRKVEDYNHQDDKKNVMLADTLETTNADCRTTRSSVSPPASVNNCLFCNGDGSENCLTSARTLPLGNRIWEGATVLKDGELLLKLAGRDIVAMGAKYHRSCLTHFYNRLRKHNNNGKSPDLVELTYGLAVEEIIEYIANLHEYETDISHVFQLQTLTNLVIERMENQGVSHEDAIAKVHKTRFKNTLIERLPNLKVHLEGRSVFFTFDCAGSAAMNAMEVNMQENGVLLKKTAELLRNDIFETHFKFNGQFDKNAEKDAVSGVLVSFLQVLLQGSNIKDKASEQTKRAALSIAQIVQFNITKTRTHSNFNTTARHASERETPLPLYIGLEIYALTRKKSLINKLSKLGVSVSYTRVQNVSDSLASSLCKYYADVGVVRPPGAASNIFTTCAIDNIDHNTSSSTSMNAFHGTSISLIQHPDVHGHFSYALDLETEKTLCLPESYTNVPFLPSKRSEYLLPTVCTLSLDHQVYDPFKKSIEWLEAVRSVTEVDGATRGLSWAGFHARKSVVKNEITPTFLLPLLNEYIATPAMIRHCINIASSSIKGISPMQTPVITGDQPVYALIKQVQWQMPNVYGEDHLVAMMGGLHIEMATLNLIGTWLDGSGWIQALISAGVTTQGRGEMVLSGKHVKKARYSHQVSLSALHILLMRAWKVDEELTVLSFDEWVKANQVESTQFLYWYITMKLEALMLMLVSSLREANVLEYISALSQICPWMFALDHTHYSRWLPVFINTLKELPERHPEVWEEFQKGHFTSRRTKRPFSSVSDDQIHEQNNKIVKTDGGPIGLFDNPTALLKWMVSSPEISRILVEYELSCHLGNQSDDNSHHEDTASFDQRFIADVSKLVDVIQSHGNPFEDKSKLTSLIEKRVMNPEVETSVRNAEVMGNQQYTQFVQERLIEGKVSVYNPIKRNSFRAECRVVP